MRSTPDTSVLVDLQNGMPWARGELERSMKLSGGLYLTAPVFAEFLTGLERASPRPPPEDVEEVLRAANVVPFDEAAARIYAREVARLIEEGKRPPIADAQIAACALAGGFEVVTGDKRDFTRFAGLVVRIVGPKGGHAGHA